jgi:hypothetical protein
VHDQIKAHKNGSHKDDCISPEYADHQTDTGVQAFHRKMSFPVRDHLLLTRLQFFCTFKMQVKIQSLQKPHTPPPSIPKINIF